MVLVNHVIEMKHQLNHQIYCCLYAGVWVSAGVKEKGGEGCPCRQDLTVMTTQLSVLH